MITPVRPAHPIQPTQSQPPKPAPARQSKSEFARILQQVMQQKG